MSDTGPEARRAYLQGLDARQFVPSGDSLTERITAAERLVELTQSDVDQEQTAPFDARESAPAGQAADRAMSPEARHRYVQFLHATTTWEEAVRAAERARASLNRLLAVWDQLQRPDLGRWGPGDDDDGLSAIDRSRRF